MKITTQFLKFLEKCFCCYAYEDSTTKNKKQKTYVLQMRNKPYFRMVFYYEKHLFEKNRVIFYGNEVFNLDDLLALLIRNYTQNIEKYYRDKDAETRSLDKDLINKRLMGIKK